MDTEPCLASLQILLSRRCLEETVMPVCQTMKEESLAIFELVPAGEPADRGPLSEELRQVMRWG